MKILFIITNILIALLLVATAFVIITHPWEEETEDDVEDTINKHLR